VKNQNRTFKLLLILLLGNVMIHLLLELINEPLRTELRQAIFGGDALVLIGIGIDAIK
jgi:hypothetical protein